MSFHVAVAAEDKNSIGHFCSSLTLKASGRTHRTCCIRRSRRPGWFPWTPNDPAERICALSFGWHDLQLPLGPAACAPRWREQHRAAEKRGTAFAVMGDARDQPDLSRFFGHRVIAPEPPFVSRKPGAPFHWSTTGSNLSARTGGRRASAKSVAAVTSARTGRASALAKSVAAAPTARTGKVCCCAAPMLGECQWLTVLPRASSSRVHVVRMSCSSQLRIAGPCDLTIISVLKKLALWCH